MKKVLSVLVVALFVAACGGSSPTSPGPQPWTQSVSGSVSSYGITYHPFTPPRSGTATITLNWGSSNVDLDLYLLSAKCDSYPIGSCGPIARGVKSSGTGESISATVTANQQYYVYVDNLDAAGQSYTLGVTVQ